MTKIATNAGRAITRVTKVVFAKIGVIALLTAVLLPGMAHAAKLYRYQNDDNGWVLASSVPNDRVKNGYEIVDETGKLIEAVAPQRSPSEARAYIAQLEAEQAREEAIRRINLLYRSEADIAYALKKSLLSIDNSVANMTANLRQLEAQRKRLETQAARIERAGNTLSKDMAANITTLAEQISNLQMEINHRIEQKDGERARHARDRVLFREVYGAEEAEDDSALALEDT